MNRPRHRDAGLSRQDLQRAAAHFGVAEEQVRRDHAISHLLAATSQSLKNEVIFFGGTALSRTYLTRQRLSEDVDLIAVADRRNTASELVRTINSWLMRSHGRPSWNPGFSDRDIEVAVVRLPGDISIKVQLLDARGYEPWPTEVRQIEQRYTDVPPTALRVPTLQSFAGWKTAAWHDRRAPRDLYDLWALASIDALTADAAALFAQHGPIGAPPRDFMFRTAPTESAWTAALAGQTRLEISAVEALTTVRRAWALAVGEDWEGSVGS